MIVYSLNNRLEGCFKSGIRQVIINYMRKWGCLLFIRPRKFCLHHGIMKDDFELIQCDI